MKDLVEVIAKALVDNPDEVSVSEKKEGRTTVLELHVAEGDMGKVIGKQDASPRRSVPWSRRQRPKKIKGCCRYCIKDDRKRDSLRVGVGSAPFFSF